MFFSIFRIFSIFIKWWGYIDVWSFRGIVFVFVVCGFFVYDSRLVEICCMIEENNEKFIYVVRILVV